MAAFAKAAWHEPARADADVFVDNIGFSLRSYNRRTGSERTFAWLQDPATIGMRRGWCRLMGLSKNALMYNLAVVVRNVRIVESFEARLAEEARRAAIGLPRRRRRRRHRQDKPEPRNAPLDEHPHEPG